MQIPQTEIIITRDGVELARGVVNPGEYVLGCEPSMRTASRTRASPFDRLARRPLKTTRNTP
jgi:hypothetical protein